jgi:glycosyltransferase involved in cell wall biosynthesis
MSGLLRVLFVAGSLGGGGAERRLIDLIRHCKPNQISPRLYLAYRRGELLSEVPPGVPIEAFGDGCLQHSLLQRLLAKFRCPSMARALHLRDVVRRNPVDVIVSWSLLCSYEVALARLGCSIPQIASSVVEPRAERIDAFSGHPLFRRERARWTYRSASLVVANSDELRGQLISCYRLPPRKVVTWLNSRDFARIDQLASEEPPPWPDLGRRVVAAGRLVPQKGFDLLLRAVARLHRSSFPVQVAILGQGPDEPALRELAGKLGIAGQVRWLGYQANPFAVLRTADVFVLSSRFEGMPNSLIEAIACRVPVVAADCPTGPREILENGCLGSLVAVEDVDALANGIQNVLQRPPSQEFLEAARRSVIERFGIETGIRRLEDLLRHVVSAESRS